MASLLGGLHGLLDTLAPKRCPGCDHPHPPGDAGFCGACRVLLDPAPGGPAVLLYGGPLADAIRRLKYEGRTDHAADLAALLLPAVAPLTGRIDAVVPVPLHRRRLARRGFNQAALLGAPVARALGVPLDLGRLGRRRATAPQVALPRKAREHNVRGAFSARRDPRRSRVLLLDDVYTTGATLRAARGALRDAGCAAVHVLCLAGGAGGE